MATKKKREPKVIEPFWKEFVTCWFKFCQDTFGEPPSFDGSSPRDLKNIIKSLHERATAAQVEWTLEVATSRFLNFLNYAIQDPWLRKNFLLFNINRQKDKIFYSIRAAITQQSNPFE